VKARGVILDRDGTLIDVVRDEETGTISTAFHPSQLRLLPGVVEGLSLLASHGYALAIATNQPGPAKGHFSSAAVHATNAALVAMLAREDVHVAHVAVCMHHPSVAPCDCRKPKPGLLVEAAAKLDLDLAASWMVGDSGADVEAGRAAGAKTGLLFDSNRCELCPLRGGATSRPDLQAPTLLLLARAIVAHP